MRAMVATSCLDSSRSRPSLGRYRRPVRGALAASWPALRVFVWSRLALWAVAAATVLAFEDELNPNRDRWDSPRQHELGAAVDVWSRWDSEWYLRIAESGYDWPSSTPAFFPLYPLLVGGLGRVLGGHFLLAGLVVSLAAGAVAFALLYRLVRRRFRPDDALRSVIYLAIFPTSLFLGAVYAESLFLALAIGTFVLVEERRVGWASVTAGLALLTRPYGIALLPALAVFAWRSDRRRRDLALLGVPVALFLAFPLALELSARARARVRRRAACLGAVTGASRPARRSRPGGRRGGRARPPPRPCAARRSRSSPGGGSERRTGVYALAAVALPMALPVGAARRPLLLPASRARRVPVPDRPRAPRARPARPPRRGHGSGRVARSQRGSMGAVVLGRVTEVPRSKLIGWVALVAVLASISYAANLLASTDTDVVAATNTAPVEITTDGEHGFATGDAVTVRDVEGNTGANGTWKVTVRSETTFVLDGSEGSGAYTSGGTVAPGDLLYRWSTVIAGVVQYGIILAVVLLIARGLAPAVLGLRATASRRAAAGWIAASIVLIWIIGALLNPFLEAGEEQGLVPDDWDPDRAARLRRELRRRGARRTRRRGAHVPRARVRRGAAVLRRGRRRRRHGPRVRARARARHRAAGADDLRADPRLAPSADRRASTRRSSSTRSSTGRRCSRRWPCERARRPARPSSARRSPPTTGRSSRP